MAGTFHGSIAEKLGIAGEDIPKPGLGDVAKQTIKRTAGLGIQGAGLIAEDIGGKNSITSGMRGYGQSLVDENPQQIGSLGDIVDMPGTAIAETASQFAPNLAGSLVGAKVMSKALSAVPNAYAKTAGGIMGGLLPVFTQETAEIRGALPETAASEEKAKAYAAAGLASGLELVAGPEGKIIRGLTPIKGIKQVGKEALKSAGEEGVQEMAQTGVERWGKSQDLAGQEAIDEYLLSGALGAIGGGVVGGGIAGVQTMLPEAKAVEPTVDPQTGAPVPTDAAPAAPTALLDNTIKAPGDMQPPAGDVSLADAQAHADEVYAGRALYEQQQAELAAMRATGPLSGAVATGLETGAVQQIAAEQAAVQAEEQAQAVEQDQQAQIQQAQQAANIGATVMDQQTGEPGRKLAWADWVETKGIDPTSMTAMSPGYKALFSEYQAIPGKPWPWTKHPSADKTEVAEAKKVKAEFMAKRQAEPTSEPTTKGADHGLQDQKAQAAQEVAPVKTEAATGGASPAAQPATPISAVTPPATPPVATSQGNADVGAKDGLAGVADQGRAGRGSVAPGGDGTVSVGSTGSAERPTATATSAAQPGASGGQVLPVTPAGQHDKALSDAVIEGHIKSLILRKRVADQLELRDNLDKAVEKAKAMIGRSDEHAAMPAWFLTRAKQFDQKGDRETGDILRALAEHMKGKASAARSEQAKADTAAGKGYSVFEQDGYLKIRREKDGKVIASANTKGEDIAFTDESDQKNNFVRAPAMNALKAHLAKQGSTKENKDEAQSATQAGSVSAGGNEPVGDAADTRSAATGDVAPEAGAGVPAARAHQALGETSSVNATTKTEPGASALSVNAEAMTRAEAISALESGKRLLRYGEETWIEETTAGKAQTYVIKTKSDTGATFTKGPAGPDRSWGWGRGDAAQKAVESWQFKAEESAPAEPKLDFRANALAANPGWIDTLAKPVTEAERKAGVDAVMAGVVFHISGMADSVDYMARHAWKDGAVSAQRIDGGKKDRWFGEYRGTRLEPFIRDGKLYIDRHHSSEDGMAAPAEIIGKAVEDAPTTPADETDLGALFDEVLAEETAPKKKDIRATIKANIEKRASAKQKQQTRRVYNTDGSYYDEPVIGQQQEQAEPDGAFWTRATAMEREAMLTRADLGGSAALMSGWRWDGLSQNTQAKLRGLNGIPQPAAEKKPVTPQVVPADQQKGPYAAWRDGGKDERTALLKAAGYVDADQVRVLAATSWEGLTDPVRRALSGSKATAGQAAKSAAQNAAAGLSDTIDALGALFGGAGKLSAGLTFDEETYAKAKPLFKQAIAHFKDAGTDMKEAMRAIIRMVMDKFGAKAAENMKPYVVRFMEDVRDNRLGYDGNENSPEKSNVDRGNDREGAQALGQVAAGEDARTQAEQGVRSGDQGGSNPGAAGNESADAAGVQGVRGRGGRAGAVHPAEAGTGREPGGLGARGAGGEGSGSQQPDARVVAPNVPAGNFVITDDVRLGKGGEVEKFNDNLAAIRTLKQIERENRRSTADEKRTLARYVGWGGLANAFANQATGEIKAGWEARAKELSELLSPAELKAARRSTRNAHFTSEVVVRGMWEAAQRLGFNGGMVLEPSAGVGNFIGMMPEALSGQSRFVAVEYDSLTARIAKALYPQATIIHSGFQKVPITDGSFDLAIGNPPFGTEKLNFQYKPELNGASIHNQFFRASLDALRPGGLQIMVVSRYLMDAKDSSQREALAEKAELLGAIRLPDTAFKENARTEVVTDILFLRRRDKASEEAMAEAIYAMNRPKKRVTASEQADIDARMALLPEWLKTGEVRDPLGGEAITINQYFVAHQGMMLGTIERSGTMRGDNDVTLRLDKGSDLAAMLSEAVRNLPAGVAGLPHDAVKAAIDRHQTMSESLEIAVAGNEPGEISLDSDGRLIQVYERETPEGEYELARREINPDTPWSQQLLMDSTGHWFKLSPKIDEATGLKVKEGRGLVYDREVYQNEAEIPAGLRLGKAKFERLKAMVNLRDLLKRQLKLEAEDAQAGQIEANRAALATAYRKFVKDNGFINAPKNAALVSEMPDGALVMALELSYKPEISKERAANTGDKPRAAMAKPAPILSERVVVPYVPPETAGSPADALFICLSEQGRPDMARIGRLLGTDEAGAIAKLHDETDEPLVFLDPETGRWETRNDYLTGTVRRKLEAAREAGMPKNIAALEKVQPEPWGAENISVKLGAGWVPAKHYEDFIKHLVGGTARVRYSEVTNSFDVRSSETSGAKAIDEWGTKDYPVGALLGRMMNNLSLAVYREDADGKRHRDDEATALAIAKAKEINNEFADWVFSDSARRNDLVQIFNDKFNTRVMRQHDGSHLTLPGKVPDMIISMRRHQKNAIWRGITERFMLLDHVVGAGKTFTAIARAIERRRLGLAKKPLIVVPNHLVEQFAVDVYRLYPGAKVLAAGKHDFEKKRRRRLFAKIATGDWDVVVVPHSSFGFLDLDPETSERFLDIDIAIANKAIDEAWEQAKEDGEDQGRFKPFNVKEAERVAETMTNRLDKLRAKRRDRLLTFEQIGVDDLTVDEAHEFKNLYYNSRLSGVRGMGNKVGSTRAYDLYGKVRYLRESPNGAVTFMTGTPISNSAVEMYTLMRYLAADELRELGLEHFDAWRAQFVDVDTGYEQNEAGQLKEVNRLGRTWSNMRSLMDLYYSFTDAVTIDDIKKWYAEDNAGQQFPVPKVKGGGRQNIIVQPTPEQSSILDEVLHGFDTLDTISDVKVRNATRLRLMDRARKVSVAARVANPYVVDSPGGKLDEAASQIKRIYDKWTEDKGTQLVFIDRSVPKAKGDDKIIKRYDELRAKQDAALRGADEETYLRITDEIEELGFSNDDIEAMRIAQRGGWNAYQQLKDNLVKLGIPANEVRFVQEATNDAQKKALFDAVNLGEVRVMIGSTPRMGAGTNVQERIVGLHHIDVTWKPSDIEQREGRGVRQGNSLLEKYGLDNFELEILAYATERTVDAKMWALNATKLKTINAIRKYDGSFTMEIEDADSVSMAEMAALASGDPLLLERVQLMSEIDRLEILERAHRRKRYAMDSEVEESRRIIATYPGLIAEKAAQKATIEQAVGQATKRNAEARIDIDGKEFDKPFDAIAAVTEEIERQKNGDEKAKFTLNINGKRYSDKTKVEEAIFDVFGDSSPFMLDDGDTVFNRRTNAARDMAAKVRDAWTGLEEGATGVLSLGKFLGFKLEADISYAKGRKDTPQYNVGLSLSGDDGRTVASDYETAYASIEEFKSPSMRSQLERIERAAMAVDEANYTTRLEKAKRELPGFEEALTRPFTGADELKEKRARFGEVTKALAEKGAKLPDGKAKFSRSEGVGKGMAVRDVQAVVDLYTGRLGNAPKVHVLKRWNEAPEELQAEIKKAKAQGSVNGAFHEGAVYLFAERLGSVSETEKVLMHELTHYGFRGLFGKDGDALLMGIYMAHADIREAANAAMRKHADLSRVQAVEEVLADLGGDRISATVWDKVVAFVRRTLRNIGFKLVMTDAEIRALVAASLDYSKKAGGRGIGGYVGGTAFSDQSGESFAAEALAELADVDELFRYKVSKARTIDAVMAEVMPSAKYVGEDVNPDNWNEFGAEFRYMFKTSTGNNFYVYEDRDGRVWIDVSRLQEGDFGGAIYAAVANYAHNTGAMFVGDPAGLSEAAAVRRTSHMLSSALRFGTTRHLEPSPEQIKGNTLTGRAPLKWSGNDVDKVQALIHTFISTTTKQFPKLNDYRFDFARNEFVDADGGPVGRERFSEGAKGSVARGARAGEATLRRAIFLKSLVSSGGGERPGILEQVLTGGRALVTTGGLNAMFSRDTTGNPELASFLGKIGGKEDKNILGKTRASFDQARANPKSALQAFTTWARQKAVDQYESLRQIDMQLMGKDFLDKGGHEASGWVLAKMARAGEGALEAMWIDGMPYLDGKAINVDSTGKGLASVFSKLQGEEREFLAWVAANRSAEILRKSAEAAKMVEQISSDLERLQDARLLRIERKDLEGIEAVDRLTAQFKAERARWQARADVTERLFSPEEVAAGQKLNAGTMPDGKSRMHLYGSVFKEFKAYQTAVLDIAEQTGLIEPAGEDELGNPTGRALWESEFYVPFYRVIEDDDNTVRGPGNVNALVRQQAFKHLKGGAENLNDLLQNTLANFHHLLSASLKNQAAVQALENAEKVGAAEVAMPGETGKDVIWVNRDGLKTYYRVLNPAVMESISALSWNGFKDPAMRGMEAFKRWYTLSVTANPAFIARNLLRDSIHSIAVTGLSKNVLKNIKEGWRESNIGDLTHARMRAGGGAFHFGYVLGDDSKAAERLINEGVPGESILDSLPKLQSMWRKYEEFGSRVENVSRAAVYAQLREQGKTHLEASFAARDVLDFSQRGSAGVVRFLSYSVPFLNARLQGLDKLGRAFADTTQRAQFMQVAGAVVVASLLLYAMYYDDPDFKEREEWDRDTYWWFKIPGTEQPFRFPKPFEVGAIGTVAERIAEQFMDDEATGKLFRQRLLHILSDQFAFNPVPQMILPAAEVWGNKDTFTDRPIESMGMERLSPGERKGQHTSLLAQALADTANAGGARVSPLQVDHLVSGYLGWVGASLAASFDWVAEVAGAKADTSTPFLYGLPVVGGVMRGFLPDQEANSSKYVSQFYEQAKAINEAFADYRLRVRQGDKAGAQELMDENGAKIRMHKLAAHTQDTITKINGQIRKVELRDDLTSAQKHTLISALKARKNLVAKKAAVRIGEVVQ